MHALMLLAFIGLDFPCPVESKQDLRRFEYERVEMGVQFRLALYAPDEPTANSVSNEAFDRIAELNRIMSDYDSQSELSRLCRSSGPGKPVKVSEDLRRVLSCSLLLSRQSDGAFDVSVGPLTRLWRRARRRKQLPSRERITEARQRVGYQWIRLDETTRTVELMKSRMQLDLGGIAKGYAADAAIDVLARHGIRSALVDASGDIVVSDPPPDGTGWRIAVDGSKNENGRPRHIRSLPPFSNRAVATSGDAYQHVEIDGTRYSHIVDPATGIGLTTPGSVTVIASNGMTADALASAVSVLGPERGLALVEKTPNAAALIILQRGTGLEEFRSSRWPANCGAP